jgi:hypothetical protein
VRVLLVASSLMRLHKVAGFGVFSSAERYAARPHMCAEANELPERVAFSVLCVSMPINGSHRRKEELLTVPPLR